MSGRRPRLVIKPNIRPGGGAAKTTPLSKPKSSIETAGLSKTPTNTVDKVTASETENQKDKEEKTKPIVTIPPAEGIPSNEITAGKTINAEQCDEVSQPEPEKDPQIPPSVEVPTTKTHEVEVDLNENTAESSSTVTSFKTPKPAVPQQQASSATSKANVIAKDSIDGTPVATKVENVKTAEEKRPNHPSEVDESETSVASSLEPDHERQAEVDETPGKKQRRHRSKKPKLEALPSRDKSPDRQKMKMSDLLLWNPERNFLPSKPKKKRNLKDENRPTSPEEKEQTDDKAEAKEEAENAALPAPQVMIGPDGNVVLNTESLLISTPEKESQGRSKIIIEEDDDDRYLNTNSYRKYHKKKLWSEEETDRFFLGLSMCGTDFSLLTKLLTNRSRRELKNKFIREEKHRRPRVDTALSNMRQYDPSAFVEKSPPPPKPKIKKQPKESKAVKSTKAPEPSVKDSKTPAKKEPPASKKKAKKRKHPESSEDEEDDWGPEYDEFDEEEEMAARLPAYKTKSRQNVDEEANKMGQTNQPSSSVVSGSVRQGQAMINEARPLAETGPSSSTAARRDTPAPQVPKPPTGIQAIPGTTQVQIEVSGVQTPVQGMLIPSHMVPALAPQLGLGEGALGGRVQVLLVHEESADGSLVHVYIIPEDNSSAASSESHGSQSLTGQTAGPSGSTPGVVLKGGAKSGGQGQTQHPLHQAGRNPVPVQLGAKASSSSPSSSLHQQTPLGGYSATVGASPLRVQSPFPPTHPAAAGAQSQRQFSSPFSPKTGVKSPSPFPLASIAGVKSPSPFPPAPIGGVKSPSPFPPASIAGVKSPSPFPPTRSPSPYLQAAGSKSPAPFPPTTRAGSSSPFPLISGTPSPVGLRPRSPFPPVQTGRKASPFPNTESSAPISTLPLDVTLFPMSPPTLQGHTPLGRMPRPKPQVSQNAQNLVRDIYSESMASPVTVQSNPSWPASSLPNVRTNTPIKNSAVTDKDYAGPPKPLATNLSNANNLNFSEISTTQLSNISHGFTTPIISSGGSRDTHSTMTIIRDESTASTVQRATDAGSINVPTGNESNLAAVLSEAQGILSALESTEGFAAVGKVVVNTSGQQQNKS